MDFFGPIILSLKIALISTPVTLIIGLFLVKLLQKQVRLIQIVFELIILVPLVLPPSVVGFILIVLFGRTSLMGKFIESMFHQSLIFTWWAGVLAAVVVSIPLMYQSLSRGFSAIDANIKGAARVDGSSEWKIFLKIELPLAITAILSGLILSFARAMGEFGATLMFAGNIPGKTQTTSTAIYTAMEVGNMKLAWTYVLILIILSFLFLGIIQVLSNRRQD